MKGNFFDKNKISVNFIVRRIAFAGCLLACLFANPVASLAQGEITGTPIGSSGGTGTHANVFDNNFNTSYSKTAGPFSTGGTPYVYLSPTASSQCWVGLDLGAKHRITQIAYAPATGKAAQMELGVFEGANDPSFRDAIPIYMVPVANTPVGSLTTVNITCSRAFRYVRYLGPVYDDNTWQHADCSVAELKFYGITSAGDDSQLPQITNIPSVVVHLDNNAEVNVKGTYLNGVVTFISNNGTTVLSSETQMKGRGNATWNQRRKPYRLKMANSLSPLGHPAKGKSWTLLSVYGDRHLLRNQLAYKTAKLFEMPYSPAIRLVNLFFNGEYRGVYQFCDQIDIREHRVDITEMKETDVSGTNLTGGYLLEIDGYAYLEDPSVRFWTTNSNNPNLPGNYIPVTIKSPDEDVIQPSQKAYIENHFNAMFSAINNTNWTNPTTGYRKYLDTKSWCQRFLTEELISNLDQIWSVYFFKHRGDDKMYLSPVWDFDNSAGSGWSSAAGQYNYGIRRALALASWGTSTWGTNWGYNQGTVGSGQQDVRGVASMFRKLLTDPALLAELKEMWAYYRDRGIISVAAMHAMVDNFKNEVGTASYNGKSAIQLNYRRWRAMESEYANEPALLKRFFELRVPWMDMMLGYSAKVIPDATGRVYVKEGGAGTKKGTTWANAYPNLADVLEFAKTNSDIKEIWVAKGTYYPAYRTAAEDTDGTPTTDRDNAFVIKEGLKIYGGFSGTETALAQRNPHDNPTVLSGDLNKNGSIDNSDAFHVVVGVGLTAATVFDGFVVQDGNANNSTGAVEVDGKNIERSKGGGVYISGGSPTLAYLTVQGNYAVTSGAGLLADGATPTVYNSVISGNSTPGNGGGVSCEGSTASPVLVNVTLANNYAGSTGGGVFTGSGTANIKIYNTVIWGNSGASGIVGVSTPTLEYSLVLGIDGTVAPHNGKGNLDGTKSINNPLFIGAQSAGATPLKGGDYSLSMFSPLIDKGDNTPNNYTNYTTDYPKDLGGSSRVLNAVVEIGAFEVMAAIVPSAAKIVYVDSTKNGDGSSWAAAYPNLADPLRYAAQNPGNVTQIFVAKGTYFPLHAAADQDNTATQTTERDHAFVLLNNVEIYGGFPTGGCDFDKRNTVANKIILSGDIGTGGYDGDNAYHVVIAANLNSTSVLDGFIIADGNANGASTTSVTVNSQVIARNNGGGLYSINPTLTVGITLSNVSVRNSKATGNGGGMYFSNGAPNYYSGSVTGGSAANGGGMYLNTCRLTADKITVSNNVATTGSGGGIYLTGTNSLVGTNFVINSNTAQQNGGGMFIDAGNRGDFDDFSVEGNQALTGKGGGIYDNGTVQKYYDFLIAGNKAIAGSGGGIHFGTSATPVTLYNFTIAGNSDYGAYNERTGTNYLITRSVFYGNENTYSPAGPGGTFNPSECYIEGTVGDIDGTLDPRFLNPMDYTFAPTTVGDYRLLDISPLIDATLSSTAAPGDLRDLAGLNRLVGTLVDAGAYEWSALSLIKPDNHVIYVDSTKNGDGSSWENAYPNLADPLLYAATDTTVYSIYVAKGTYFPMHVAGNGVENRDKAFVLVKGVSIKGGYASGGYDRNRFQYPTVLSGNLGNLNSATDDAYHVVIGIDIPDDKKTIIDGVTITRGNSIDNPPTSNSFVRIDGRNVGRGSGAGVVNINSSPTFSNVTITANRSNEIGAGMLNSSNSSPHLINAYITGNYAKGDGAGIYNVSNSSPFMFNIVFSGNKSDGNGGAIYNNLSSPAMVNITVSGNYANLGGAMYNNSSATVPSLANSIIMGNRTNSGTDTKSIYNENNALIIPKLYSLVEGENENPSWHNLEGLSPAVDPQFVDPKPFASAPTAAGDYSLKYTSPLIDKGYAASNYQSTDIRMNYRIRGFTIDLGAFEMQQAAEGYPDNINDTVYCNIQPPARQWSIKKSWESTFDDVEPRRNWLVGDLDGDGMPEIVATVYSSRAGVISVTGGGSNDNNYHAYQKIVIFPGGDNTARQNALFLDFSKQSEASTDPWFGQYHSVSSYALFKDNGMGLIVVLMNDGHISAYIYDPAYYAANGGRFQRLWTSNSVAHWGDIRKNTPTISIADFNNDGIPEIYCNNKIFSGRSGQLLCSGPDWSASPTTVNVGFSRSHTYDALAGTPARANGGTFPVAADIDGDGILELVIGNQCYKVTIPAGAITAAGCNMIQWKDITPPTVSIPGTASGSAYSDVQVDNDGHVSIADFNNDGHPDALISKILYSRNCAVFYGWDIHNDKILFKAAHWNGAHGAWTQDGTIYPIWNGVPNGAYSVNGTGVITKSIPFIGDIDGDGNLNIMCMVDRKLIAYNVPTSLGPTVTLPVKWEQPVDEATGRTGISLFDFNQDGQAELVYRDHTRLRIIDGSAASFDTLATFWSGSTTSYELPLVVDIDRDGKAEMVVAGHPSTRSDANARMAIYEEGDGAQPWAPARAVWNQYAYNIINVNNDLTIPKKQWSISEPFPGLDGELGTLDDVRPYNSFLQQQTILDRFGNPLWLAPNAQYAGSPIFNYDRNIDSLTITLNVRNVGEADFQSPFKITVYKNNVGNATKYVYSYPQVIKNGETHTITIGIANFSRDFTPFTDIVIRLNDNGDGGDDQDVCDDAFRDHHTGPIIGVDDHNVLFQNSTDNVLNVTENDFKVCEASILIRTMPKHGAAYVQDTAIIYTPDHDFLGGDTIVYVIACSSTEIDTATVYITVVPRADNINDSATCYGYPPITAWANWGINSTPVAVSNRDDVSTLMPPLVGDFDNNGRSEIVVSISPSGDGLNFYETNKRLMIYRDGNIAGVGQQFGTEQPYSVKSGGAVALAKYVNHGTNTSVPIIVVASTDNYLYAYDADGAPLWKSDSTWNYGAIAGWTYHPVVGVTDFGGAIGESGGDTYPEIYVGNRVFDAQTGKLVLTVGGYGAVNRGILRHASSSANYAVIASFASDIDGDGRPDLVCGNVIYNKISITNHSGISGNTAFEERYDDVMSAYTGTKPVWMSANNLIDGYSSIADFDGDGKPDVLVQNMSDVSGNTVYFFAYSPSKREALGSFSHTTTTTGDNLRDNGISHPLIADIDGDNTVELVFSLPSEIRAYDYSYGVGSGFFYKWRYPTSDVSGAIGVTGFDFNSDYITEIIARDQDKLLIINGNTSTDPVPSGNVKSVSNLYSSTRMEYPIVADIDDDGVADLLVVGGSVAGTNTGTLRRYAYSGTNKWAQARPVWNQYLYNSININKDLTVPKTLINPAAIFPSKDHQIGTSDDIQPYNNFMQQQTILNRDGDPLWLLPDAALRNTSDKYYPAGDSLVITGTIYNIGSATLYKKIYIASYRNGVASSANSFKVDSINLDLNVGDSVKFRILYLNFTSSLTKTVLLRVNDKGQGVYVQAECNEKNNYKLFSITLLKPNDDYIDIIRDQPIDINVLANDTIPSAGTTVVSIATPPVHGTATIVGDEVRYTPAAGFVGEDSIQYKLANVDEAYAWIYIIVHDYHDNVIQSFCDSAAANFDWVMRRLAASPLGAANVNATATGIVFTGDIDDDGKVELVTAAHASPDGLASAILIFEVDNGAATLQQTVPTPMFNAWANPIAIGNVDGGTTAAIFLATDGANNSTATDKRRLIKYVFSGGSYSEAWRQEYTTNNSYAGARPALVDFNGDGVAEVSILDRVYNAASGSTLVDGGLITGASGLMTTGEGFGLGGHAAGGATGSRIHTAHTAIADIDNDGIPELIGGNSVYKVNIAAGTLTEFKRAETDDNDTPHAEALDGAAAVADMDNDGALEVVVTTMGAAGNVNSSAIYIWNPRTGKVVNNNIVTGLKSYKTDFARQGISAPTLGDIDGDGYPEVVVVVVDSMYAYRYEVLTHTLERLWQRKVNDASGATGMSLFDFNIDGRAEVVYRDQDSVWIINGLDGSAYASYLCKASTEGEYPTIADVNRDGKAEILVTGYTSLATETQIMVIAPTADRLWAPAPDVWNQPAYNAVNINSMNGDPNYFKVPALQMHPAVVYPGNDGTMGTYDDLRPYNNYLQQQTTINPNGEGILLVPDLMIFEGPHTTLYPAGDSVVLEMKVTNDGDANIPGPWYYAVYHDDATVVSNKILSGSVADDLGAGETVIVRIKIVNYSSYGGAPIIVRLNDKGDAKYEITECDYGNNVAIMGVLEVNDDYVTMLNSDAGGAQQEIKIPMLDNDLIPTNGANTITIDDTPDHGTATIVNDTIVYKPNPGFFGRDSLSYVVTNVDGAETNSDTAYIYIMVYEIPDNINDTADCIGTPPTANWDIREVMAIDSVMTTNSVVAGDLNNDGYPDLVYLLHDSKIGISWGPAFTTRTTINRVAERNSLAIGKVQMTAGVYKTLIFAKNSTDIFAYDPLSPATAQWSATCLSYGGTIGLADFNSDGWTEVYFGNVIYDAATGVKLCDGGADNKGLTRPIKSGTDVMMPQAYDIVGDSRLELIAGNQIYDVVITSRTGMGGNSITVVKTVTPPVVTVADGLTVVADFDNDGKLEVLVRSRDGSATNNIYLYLWTPHTPTPAVLASLSETSNHFGIPFVGDIDGKPDGLVEIISLTTDGSVGVTQTNRFNARRFNASTNSFESVWNTDHTDQSGATAMSLFDFDQDGKNEIVYRDETTLRIINGSVNPPTVKATFNAYSETSLEYPIIVDLFNSGQSNIVVTSDYKTARPFDGFAKLKIFGAASSGDPWAPARPVWSQYSYNPVVVNRDLTTPLYQLTPAITLPGPDHILGTADDVRPFNNFLQQATVLNKYGEKLWLLPDLEIVSGTVRTTYYGTGDSLVVYFDVTNIGDAGMTPVHYVAYKNSVGSGNKLANDSAQVTLNPGDTITAHLRIAGYRAANVTGNIVLRVNDKGAAAWVFDECNYSNNILSVPASGILQAVNDHASTTGVGDEVKIPVLDNDIYDVGTLDGFDTIPGGAKHGTVTIDPADSSLVYTPTDNTPNVDSLAYYITAGADSSVAKVYVVNSKALSKEYVACSGGTVTMGFQHISGVTYYWYNAATGGILQKATASDTIVRTKGATNDIGTWWVEPRWNGKTFPRLKVELQLSDNCGGDTPVNCGSDGSLIYKEDFGGNSPSDLPGGPELPAGTTTYTFMANNAITGGDQYSIIKETHRIPGEWHAMGDHTSVGDDTRGYMMLVDASATPGVFYQTTINGLCEGMQMYFSTWVGNLYISTKDTPAMTGGIRPRLRFVLIDPATTDTLAVYSTGNIEPTATAQWDFFGFRFVNSSNSAIKLQIYNDAPGGYGNDLVLDDIEVRICVPPVTVTPAGNPHDNVPGFKFTGTYTDDGTFGNNLSYQWEYANPSNPTVWTPVPSSMATGASGTSTSGTVNSDLSNIKLGSADSLYFRLAVSNAANINNENCRAVSRTVVLKQVLHLEDDVVSTTTNTPVIADVLANDDFASRPDTVYVSDAVAPHHGDAEIVESPTDTLLHYTPDAGWYGIDSLMYVAEISGGAKDSATVYLLTSKPLSLQYIVCPGSTAVMGFQHISGVQYYWYNAATNGTLVRATASDTIIRIKGAANDIGTWWVEPVWGGKHFPRLKVVLEESTHCADLTPDGCAATGTLLYKEDFGGNETADPRVNPVAMPANLIDLNFCSTGSGTCIGTYGYSVEKTSTYAHYINEAGGGDDHTYPNDKTRGYYMSIDPAPSQLNYKLYGSVIKGLCNGTRLSFTVWASDFHTTADVTPNCAQPKIEMLIRDASTGDTIVTSGTFTIPRYSTYQWRQFGFDFALPDGVDSILFTVVNKEVNNICNDWNLDDIEIRICVPEVKITSPVANDTTVCEGSTVNIKGTFTDDGTFGTPLAYRWEYSATGEADESGNWVQAGSQTSNPTATVNTTLATDSAGYYRLVVANAASINHYNCRAMSRIIHVENYDAYNAPDIRVQLCAGPARPFNLQAYLDSLYLNNVVWSTISGPAISTDGKFNTGSMSAPNVYVYQYTMNNPALAACGSTSARAFIRILDSRVLTRVDTITVCKEFDASTAMNLTQILGLEVDGTWSFTSPVNPDATVANNVTHVTSGRWDGAYFFDARKAYAEAGTAYNYGSSSVKIFRFRYTFSASSCVPSGYKDLVIIVTP